MSEWSQTEPAGRRIHFKVLSFATFLSLAARASSALLLASLPLRTSSHKYGAAFGHSDGVALPRRGKLVPNGDASFHKQLDTPTAVHYRGAAQAAACPHGE